MNGDLVSAGYVLTLILIFAGCIAAYKQYRKGEKFSFEDAMLVDFQLKFHTSKYWVGEFRDGGVIKNGFVKDLPREGFSAHQIIRVWVDHMKDGLWEVEPVKIELSNFPKDAVILTEREGNFWHCIFPDPQGFALAGTLENAPLNAEPCLAVITEKVKDKGNTFKYVAVA